MQQTLALVLSLVLVALAAGCDDSPSDVVDAAGQADAAASIDAALADAAIADAVTADANLLDGEAGDASVCAAGCPDDSAIATGSNTGSNQAQEIIIYSVDYETNEIVLRNVSAGTVTINNTWDICRPFAYQTLPTITLAAGAEVTVHMTASGTNTATDVFLNNPTFDVQASDELMLYRIAALHQQNNIEAYLRWGPAAPTVRQSEAVAVGLWSTGDTVTLCGNHKGFAATGDIRRAAGFTSIAAGTTCTP